ncbi:hypothetical protein Br6_04774 [Rhodococcus sp. Br-6]|nr:hypothetical protein Br6_04774 [Rhodococcus sp. Br-6]
MLRMAQPHLGDRTQLRFHAPKALVDYLSAYAERRGLAMSRTTADLLSAAAGYPNLVLSDMPLFDFDSLAADIPMSVPGELAIVKFRAPSRVVRALDHMAREAGVKRPDIAIRLLAQAVGLTDFAEEGRQLQMTG